MDSHLNSDNWPGAGKALLGVLILVNLIAGWGFHLRVSGPQYMIIRKCLLSFAWPGQLTRGRTA